MPSLIRGSGFVNDGALRRRGAAAPLGRSLTKSGPRKIIPSCGLRGHLAARPAPYLPREAAGGGPSAERSEERMVEGASGRARRRKLFTSLAWLM